MIGNTEHTNTGHVNHQHNNNILELLEHIEHEHGNALIEHEPALEAIDTLVRCAALNVHRNLSTYIPEEFPLAVQTLDAFLAVDAAARSKFRHLLHTPHARETSKGRVTASVRENKERTSELPVQMFQFTCRDIHQGPEGIVVSRSVANQKKIADKLQLAFDQLDAGTLTASYDRNAAIKIEEPCGHGFLVGLRTMTDNRLYGFYDPLMQSITWSGFAKDHNAWGRVIQQYRDVHRRSRTTHKKIAV